MTAMHQTRSVVHQMHKSYAIIVTYATNILHAMIPQDCIIPYHTINDNDDNDDDGRKINVRTRKDRTVRWQRVTRQSYNMCMCVSTKEDMLEGNASKCVPITVKIVNSDLPSCRT